jgi:hypothetical protein
MDPVDYYFEVEKAVKGDIGDEIVVKSAADGASCGLELPEGTRAGLLLDQVDGDWQGNLCWTVDADALLAAAEGPPDPVEGPPPHLIVASTMGDAGLVALGQDGEVVGYGPGPEPLLLSACPDEETFVGLTPDNRVRAWSFAGLDQVGEFQLDSTATPWVHQLLCAGPAGSPTLATTTLSGLDVMSLIRIADGDSRTIRDDVEWLLDTAQGTLIVASDGSVLAVDPGTGDLTQLTNPIGDVHGQLTSVVASPDGSHLALGAVDWSVSPIRGHAFVIDLASGATPTMEVACDVYPVWLDDGRISIWDHCNTDTPNVYTPDLTLIGPGDSTDPRYNGWTIIDEDGAVFLTGMHGLSVREPGTDTESPFGPAMGYVQAALLVPESARAAWTGSDFVPAPNPAVVNTPGAVPPPDDVPVDNPPADYDSPVWMSVVGAAVVAGVLWLLARSSSESDREDPEGPA